MDSVKKPIALSLLLSIFMMVLVDWVWLWNQSILFAESAISPPELESKKTAEAIVVLTGDSRRIPLGVHLLRQRKSEWLIISGVGRGTPLLDVINRQEGASFRVHEIWQKIIVDEEPNSTMENAEKTALILKDKKIHRMILVTSDYHMPRSYLIFKNTVKQMEVIPRPARSYFSDYWQGKENSSLFKALTKHFWEFGKYLSFRWIHSDFI